RAADEREQRPGGEEERGLRGRRGVDRPRLIVVAAASERYLFREHTIFLSVPPNLRRFLPLILIAFVLLFILPNLLNKKSSAGPKASTRATQTINAVDLIDKSEQIYKTAHGAYTSHLADLLALSHRLATDLVIGLAVDLDAGSNGQSYYARVE